MKHKIPTTVVNKAIMALLDEADSHRRENIALRTLLQAHGLTEEQIQIQVGETVAGLREYKDRTLALWKIGEALLGNLPENDLEEALRKFPGTGKPQ